MSEPTQHAPQEAQTDLQIQAAETAAGPSGAANAAAWDGVRWALKMWAS